MLIKKLSHLAAADPSVYAEVPDLEAVYRRVLDRLDRRPVTISVTDRTLQRTVNLKIGRIGLQWLLRVGSADARTYAGMPSLFASIDRGETDRLTKAIEPLYNDFKGRSAMATAMDCSSQSTPERVDTARRQEKGALFSNINLQWDGISVIDCIFRRTLTPACGAGCLAPCRPYLSAAR